MGFNFDEFVAHEIAINGVSARLADNIIMMDSSTSIIFAVLFGAIGMGYLVYGRRQHQGIPLLAGVALCAFPYFVHNVLLVILIGIVLMVLPFFLRY